jgi:hypothetical protein
MTIFGILFRLLGSAGVLGGAVLGLGNCGVDRHYSVSITRTAANAGEEALIARAEAQCPPYEEVAALWFTPPPETAECLWYYASFDGFLIPFAITGEAISYYTDAVHELEQQNAPVRASFTYTAQVMDLDSSTEVEGAVRAVQMTMQFSHWCGRLCGLWIDKERTVYFNETGEILGITGEGVTDVAVSKDAA